MHERTTSSTISFLHPFSLPGVEGEHRAGTYQVETVEELIEGLSFLAYRHIATTIMLPSPQYHYASMQAETIDPRDLEVAKEQDALRASGG